MPTVKVEKTDAGFWTYLQRSPGELPGAPLHKIVGIENPKFRSVGWRGGYCRRKRALENSANRLWRS
jgi:hypothetical protein